MNDRRKDDSRVDQLVADVAGLKSQMAENTAVTVQVRDILRSFKIIGAIAKWLAGIGAAAAAVYHGVNYGIDFLRR